MGECPARLIAWLDSEVPSEEASAIEQHVSTCGVCRERIATYRRVDAGIRAYRDSMMGAKAPGRVSEWLLASGAAAFAAAGVLALFTVVPPALVAPPPGPARPLVGRAAVPPNELAGLIPSRVQRADEVQAVPRRVMKPGRRHGPISPAALANLNLLPAEPAIEIVIPAEAVFPPGAIPEGVSFNANLTIGADGFAQRLRLWP